jgi:small subunit ribosomal protein S8
MTDPISDMLTRIRNAQMIGHSKVIIPFSRFKFALAEVLKQENYIDKIKTKKGTKFDNLEITLKYSGGISEIEELERVSKPGQRIYSEGKKAPRVKQGHGIAVISTSQGLMTDKEARKKKIGGEVVCRVW